MSHEPYAFHQAFSYEIFQPAGNYFLHANTKLLLNCLQSDNPTKNREKSINLEAPYYVIVPNFLSHLPSFFLHVSTAIIGHGLLILEVSRSHTQTHTHSVRLLWTSDQPDAETST